VSRLRYAEVIGDPIAQAKSPAIHGFWLQKAGLDGDYGARLVRVADLAGYVAERREDPAWRGCNITVPHKIAALALADRVDEAARAIGATNCLYRDSDGNLAATNTDAPGFAEKLSGVALAGKRAVVIGAGGAARAVLAALRGCGIGEVVVLNRSQDKARALLGELGLSGRAGPPGARLPADCAILVNASTLGMTGQPPLEIDLAPLEDGCIVYDIVYAPLETELLAAARRRGLPTIDGLSMLIGQAATAFEHFFGHPASRQSDHELRALLTG
jgi:shikimate dehydrogenase